MKRKRPQPDPPVLGQAWGKPGDVRRVLGLSDSGKVCWYRPNGTFTKGQHGVRYCTMGTWMAWVRGAKRRKDCETGEMRR